MKKTAYVILIIGLLIGTQFSQAKAEAFGPHFLEPQVFNGAGLTVEIPAAVMGFICGTAAGVVGGIPMCIAGTILGLPFKKSTDFGFAGLMIPATTGSLIGQIAVGTPVFITKVLFYDTPLALSNPETYKSITN